MNPPSKAKLKVVVPELVKVLQNVFALFRVTLAAPTVIAPHFPVLGGIQFVPMDPSNVTAPA